MEPIEDPWGPAPAEPRILSAGDQIGEDLTVTGVLGKGGTAVVYGAHHAVLGREVAVKMALGLGPVTREAHARLIREAQMCASVRAPYVPAIYALDRLEDGTPFVVMERIEGRSLAQTLSVRRLSVAEACALGCSLLSALEEVHCRDIVHRDIKPSNLMVHFAGPTLQLKILDFGVGKVLASEHSDLPNLTSKGELLGTPLYMAPEQVLAAPVDARADLYSAGAVLYEALTGRAPFQGDSLGEILAAVLRDELTPPHELQPDLPASVSEVVARALEKKPEARFASAAEMRETLMAAMADLRPEHAIAPVHALLPAENAPTLLHRDAPTQPLPTLIATCDSYLDAALPPVPWAEEAGGERASGVRYCAPKMTAGEPAPFPESDEGRADLG